MTPKFDIGDRFFVGETMDLFLSIDGEMQRKSVPVLYLRIDGVFDGDPPRYRVTHVDGQEEAIRTMILDEDDLLLADYREPTDVTVVEMVDSLQ